MSPFLLVSLVIVLLMAKRLVDAITGGGYSCPICGATSESGHSSHCPWNRVGPRSTHKR